MMKIAMLAAACAGLMLTGCATTQGPASTEARLERMLAGQSEMQGSSLSRAIEQANRHPLGSQQNPVRVAQPQGQRAYLAQLRCSDGQAPSYVRAGNFGTGVFGNIIDGYTVRCAGGTPAESMVYMDMYHAGHVESRPVPGFTIAGG